MSRLTYQIAASILMTCFLCITAEPAHAYLNPYDVLLSQDLILPATSRESFARVDRQQRESAARRDREQEAVFAEQRPIPEEEFFAAAGEDVFQSAVPEFVGSEDDYVDREFLSLMRTLERVKKQQNEAHLRQQALNLLAQEGLHAGAPLAQLGGFLPTGSRGLAPTGAGTVAAVAVLFFAVWWTLRRSKREEVVGSL